MAASADKWRRIYAPKTALLIGGLSRQNAVPYLRQLAEHKGLEHDLRLEAGVVSRGQQQLAQPCSCAVADEPLAGDPFPGDWEERVVDVALAGLGLA